MDVRVRSHMSTVTEAQISRLHARLERERRGGGDAVVEAASTTTRPSSPTAYRTCRSAGGDSRKRSKRKLPKPKKKLESAGRGSSPRLRPRLRQRLRRKSRRLEVEEPEEVIEEPVAEEACAR